MSSKDEEMKVYWFLGRDIVENLLNDFFFLFNFLNINWDVNSVLCI